MEDVPWLSILSKSARGRLRRSAIYNLQRGLSNLRHYLDFCRYDALEHIGHACGHNLISCAGLAAAIGVADAIKQGKIAGRVIAMGTPAEEGGGGKIKMIRAGAYDGVDCCLMVHPM